MGPREVFSPFFSLSVFLLSPLLCGDFRVTNKGISWGFNPLNGGECWRGEPLVIRRDIPYAG